MNQTELKKNLKVFNRAIFTNMKIISHLNILILLLIDKLAGQRWRTKLGRPSKVPTLGDVDPTGTYCPVPEDWLKKKYGESLSYKFQFI